MKSQIALLFLLYSLAFSQTFNSISGYVYDAHSGEALGGANVFLQNSHYGTSTNAGGYYVIARAPIGNFALSCMHIGYKNFTQTIYVIAQSPLRIDIFLTPAPIETPKVYVIADSGGLRQKISQQPVSRLRLFPQQMEKIPHMVESDLFRSLQTMPGIVAVSDFSSQLYVRGGTPDQNLYLLDGASLYNPEHLFGLFSTFNTDAIKSVSVSRGGFDAEYGGRLSSVIDVTNVDGNRRHFEGKASISLLSAKISLQAPVGKIGALTGSFRRTYFDQTFARMKAFKTSRIPNYYFLDGHVKTFLDLNADNKLMISYFQGHDDLDYHLGLGSKEPQQIDYSWDNRTCSAKWTRIFSPVLYGTLNAAMSRFQSDFIFENIAEKNRLLDHTVKIDFEYSILTGFTAKTGSEIKFLRGLYQLHAPGAQADVQRDARHEAVYLQGEWRATPGLEIRSGIRWDYFYNHKSYQNISPRFSAGYHLSETQSIKIACGRYRQYLFQIPRTVISDLWFSSNEYYGGSRADHYIVGYQKELTKNFNVELEGYYKKYYSLFFFDPFFYIDLIPSRYNDKGEPYFTEPTGFFDTGDGSARGLELLIRKNHGPLNGWLSLSISQTLNRIAGVDQDRSFPPRHDRTLIFNGVSSVDLKNIWRQIRSRPLRQDRTQWTMGFEFVFASGQPLTTCSSVYLSNPLPDQDYYAGINLLPGTRNDFRLPPYIRLDWSLTCSARFKNFTFHSFIQVYNLFNRHNVWFIGYDDRIRNGVIEQDIIEHAMLPILPSIGIGASF